MNETVKNLTTRKSCSEFKPEHITHEELDEIIAAGLNAPSGMNMQDPIIIATQDDETAAKLSALNAEAAKASLAKVNPEAAANFPSDPFYGSRDVIAVVCKKAPTAVYDGSLVMGNLLNAAWSMGIDSRWIHRCKEVFASDEGKEILAKLGITEEVEGIGFCVLGHAKTEKPKTEIKPDRVYYI
ncbi:MAG: nitroreductase family protein [Clostridiales bacterium]|nr:nitroreductase family protein [Clostridiales bacterium]